MFTNKNTEFIYLTGYAVTFGFAIDKGKTFIAMSAAKRHNAPWRTDENLDSKYFTQQYNKEHARSAITGRLNGMYECKTYSTGDVVNKAPTQRRVLVRMVRDVLHDLERYNHYSRRTALQYLLNDVVIKISTASPEQEKRIIADIEAENLAKRDQPEMPDQALI